MTFVIKKSMHTELFLSAPVKPLVRLSKQTLFVGRIYFENPFIMHISSDKNTILIADFYL